MKMKTRIAASLLLAFVLVACGREREVTEDVAGNGSLANQTVTVEIPVNVEWVPTGIFMAPGLRAEIILDRESRPLGDVKVNDLATIPTFGLHGVIGRVGREGVPFIVGESYVVQGSSLTDGEELFLGRNLAAPDPFADLVTEASAEDTASTEIVEPVYEPYAYTAEVRTRSTDSPALLTPVDGFYDDSPNPVFDWDDQNNAAQYSLDISRFRDFRSILFNVNAGSTSLNTALLGIDPTQPSLDTSTGPNLSEGVYYWRVRGQINTGRTLSPNLEWTERSVAFRLGVELEQTVPSPEVITPSGAVALDEGQFLTVEFLAQPDASGLVWRYFLYNNACQNTIAPDEDIPTKQSVWMAFQSEYRSNDIGEVPNLYGFFRTGALTKGEWLVRIQVKDGKDRNATRTGIASYTFSVGC